MALNYTGSPKQAAWAEKIHPRLVERVAAELAHLRITTSETRPSIVAQHDLVIAALRSETDAKWIIDWREASADGQMLREIIRRHSLAAALGRLEDAAKAQDMGHMSFRVRRVAETVFAVRRIVVGDRPDAIGFWHLRPAPDELSSAYFVHLDGRRLSVDGRDALIGDDIPLLRAALVAAMDTPIVPLTEDERAEIEEERD